MSEKVEKTARIENVEKLMNGKEFKKKFDVENLYIVSYGVQYPEIKTGLNKGNFYVSKSIEGLVFYLDLIYPDDALMCRRIEIFDDSNIEVCYSHIVVDKINALKECPTSDLFSDYKNVSQIKSNCGMMFRYLNSKKFTPPEYFDLCYRFIEQIDPRYKGYFRYFCLIDFDNFGDKQHILQIFNLLIKKELVFETQEILSKIGDSEYPKICLENIKNCIKHRDRIFDDRIRDITNLLWIYTDLFKSNAEYFELCKLVVGENNKNLKYVKRKRITTEQWTSLKDLVIENVLSG